MIWGGRKWGRQGGGETEKGRGRWGLWTGRSPDITKKDTLFKMSMFDPLTSQETGKSRVELFLARNTSGISVFLDPSAPDPGRRQKYSWPGREKLPMTEVTIYYLARGQKMPVQGI